MAERPRVAALAVAVALLVVLDVIIAHVNVFRMLIPDTRPMTLFAAINRQMADVVERLYAPPPGPPSIIFMGNSQFEAAIGPLPLLDRQLVEAGAPPEPGPSRCASPERLRRTPRSSRATSERHPATVVLGLCAGRRHLARARAPCR
jgi:hypothetical protein